MLKTKDRSYDDWFDTLSANYEIARHLNSTPITTVQEDVINFLKRILKLNK